MTDMGGRFRLVAAEIELIKQPKAMPRLPVARLMWKLKPDFKTGTAAWIYAGGGHHTVVSSALYDERYPAVRQAYGNGAGRYRQWYGFGQAAGRIVGEGPAGQAEINYAIANFYCYLSLSLNYLKRTDGNGVCRRFFETP